MLDSRLSRRQILRMGGLAALACLVPASVRAAAGRASGSFAPKRLSFFNTHTSERLESEYWAGGDYRIEELHRINHILRDARTGETKEMDIKLIDLLHRIRQDLGAPNDFHIICGYRSPETNASLRLKNSGVALHSLHMTGQAVDIRLPGVPLASLRRAALDLKAGGVGYYPRSGFVHVDVGPVRAW